MRWLFDWEIAWELTWAIVLLTVVPIGFGLWLDRRAHITPLGTLAGVILGMVALSWYVRYRWGTLANTTSPRGHDFHRDVKEERSCDDC